jgi:hypothetical protein
MADERSQRDVTELVQLLEHQRTLYRRLRTLADRQRTMIVQDDVQPLLSLLSERQKLVDGLVGLGRRLAPFREHWPATYGTLDEPTRRQVSELLEEANTALGSILQCDRHDTATLSARRQDVANQLSSMDGGARVGAAYAATARRASSVTDATA